MQNEQKKEAPSTTPLSLVADSKVGSPKVLSLASARYRLSVYYEQQGKNSAALRLRAKAAAQGDVTAQRELEGLVRKCIASEEVEPGDPAIQYELAVCYQWGRGVQQDSKTAVRWWQKAANQNHARAQYNLAVCYKEGRGVEKDAEQSLHWYRASAGQGYVVAQFSLGVCYEKGYLGLRKPGNGTKRRRLRITH